MSDEYKQPMLSPTSIIMWLGCPRQFYYKYVLKMPVPANIHMVKGNIVHNTLETFFKGEPQENLDLHMEVLFNKTLEKMKNELEDLKLDEEVIKKEVQDCRNMLDMFLRTFKVKMDYLVWANKANNFAHAFHLLKPKFREMWIENKDFNLCGYIDRVYTDWNGVVTIGDYKTSYKYGIGIKDEQEIQCALYALLFYLKQNEIPDYTSIIFIRFGEEVRTRVTPDQIKMITGIVKEVNSKTKTDNPDDYPLNEGKQCKFCSFFDKCSGLDKEKDNIRVNNLKEQILKRKEELAE